MLTSAYYLLLLTTTYYVLYLYTLMLPLPQTHTLPQPHILLLLPQPHILQLLPPAHTLPQPHTLPLPYTLLLLPLQVEILKSQLATKFPISNDYTYLLLLTTTYYLPLLTTTYMYACRYSAIT